MKSIFLKITLMFLCLIGVTEQNALAEKYGPNIKGFQLGMNSEEVDNVRGKLDLLCGRRTEDRPKYCKQVSMCLDENSGSVFLEDRKDQRIMVLNFKNGEVDYIEINSSGIEFLFNAVGTRKGFLQAFVNNYHLNLKAYGRNGVADYYEDKDVKQGYLIRCGCNQGTEVSNIIIKSIPKESGNFSF